MGGLAEAADQARARFSLDDVVPNPDVERIIRKYESRLGGQVQLEGLELPSDEVFSREYITFREEALSAGVSFYERTAASASRLFRVRLSPEDQESLQQSITLAHLNLEPGMAASFAALIAFLSLFSSLILGLLLFLLQQKVTLSVLLLPALLLISGLSLYRPLLNIPHTLAAKWRLKAGNQMVLCILYVVMYMRHTSNLEHAIKFATEHIGNPLALDLRKVFWDVEIGYYATIKESLDRYLLTWREWNMEFVEAFHLIESSLYEPSEPRRLERLEKALSVIIEGTYEKMLHFAHGLKNPITILHMLGIILPILGLIILPLAGLAVGIPWWWLAFLYNIFLPFIVYYFGTRILSARPTGYGGRNLLEEDPLYAQYGTSSLSPMVPAMLIFLLMVPFGFLPLILHATNPAFEQSLGTFGLFLDYRTSSGIEYGPFGLGAGILSLFIVLGIAFAIATYQRLRTKRLILIRERTQRLESEFSSALFQLGNRIGDGLPAEIAFGKVAENLRGTPAGLFFGQVNRNIRQGGMSIQDAIFDRQQGALFSFPSTLIESSMKVLVESARKSPQVVAQSLISISEYMERIHSVNERLQDLLADITSSMKGQITFLTPMIAGVVVGIGTMITTILGKLSTQISGLQATGGGEEVGFNLQQLVGILPPDRLIPPFYFQMVVGLYVVEIVILLTILSNTIENGFDKLTEKSRLSKNLYSSVLLYVLIAFAVMVAFSFLAGIVSNVGGLGS